MKKSICGIDCSDCQINEECAGCVETKGSPYGGGCVMANCCKNKNLLDCEKCNNKKCNVKVKLINEFNALNIPNMPKVEELNCLKGSFINMEYLLSNGSKIRLFEDNKIYLGNQLCKIGSDKCFGLAADENNLLICEYDNNGKNPEIVIYKKIF